MIVYCNKFSFFDVDMMLDVSLIFTGTGGGILGKVFINMHLLSIL